MRELSAPLRASLLALLLAAGACGGALSPAAPDAAGSGGTGADAAPDGTAGTRACQAVPDMTVAAPDCNGIMNGAAAVPFTPGVGSPPVLVGGAFGDGRYVATEAEGFGAAAPQNGRRLTILILNGGTRWLWAGDVLDASGTETQLSFRADADVAISGTTLTFTTTCSSTATSPLPASLEFTAKGTQLVLSLAMPTYTAVTTYTLSACE
jgi:hypothetical protein